MDVIYRAGQGDPELLIEISKFPEILSGFQLDLIKAAGPEKSPFITVVPVFWAYFTSSCGKCFR